MIFRAVMAATHQRHQRPRGRAERDLLKRQLKTYLRPELLLMDELDYLPIDLSTVRTCSSRSSASATNKAPSS